MTSLDFDLSTIGTELQALAELGPRSIGSAAESQAREIVAGFLSEAGLEARPHEFGYLGWSLGRPTSARLGAGEHAVDALAFTYSAPTPPEGVSGGLERVGEHWVHGLWRWRKFRIVGAGGETLGYVSAVPDGPAVAAALGESASPLPHFIVGADALGELSDGSRVPFWGSIDARFDATARGVNLATTIPGTDPALAPVVLTAHLDAEAGPRCAGAARALIAVLTFARAYACQTGPRTLEVVVFTGTDADIAGSKAYVADHPALRETALAINVDEIPNGEPLLVASVPESLEARLWRLLERRDSAPREYRSPLPPGGDHLPFAALGLPVLLLGRGRRALRVGDIPSAPDVDLVVNVAEIVEGVLRDVDAGALAGGSKRIALAAQRDSSWEHAMSLKQY
jgi:hypothetical protein